MYETTNTVILLYNANEKDSFLRLTEVYQEFKDNNTVGAYAIMVALVDPEVRKTVKS